MLLQLHIEAMLCCWHWSTSTPETHTWDTIVQRRCRTDTIVSQQDVHIDGTLHRIKYRRHNKTNPQLIKHTHRNEKKNITRAHSRWFNACADVTHSCANTLSCCLTFNSSLFLVCVCVSLCCWRVRLVACCVLVLRPTSFMCPCAMQNQKIRTWLPPDPISKQCVCVCVRRGIRAHALMFEKRAKQHMNITICCKMCAAEKDAARERDVI